MELRKTKGERRAVAKQVLLEIDRFEKILLIGEIEHLGEVATPHDLRFLETVARNLRQLNDLILARRTVSAETNG